jgi:hypothetical protein
MLEKIRNLAMETLATATQLAKNAETQGLPIPDTSYATHEKKEKEVIPITALQRVKQK